MVAVMTTLHVIYWTIVVTNQEDYVLADFQVERVRSERGRKRTGFTKEWIIEGIVAGKSETFRIPLRASEHEPYQRGEVVQIYHDPKGADISIAGYHLRVVPIKEFDQADGKLFLSLIGLSGSLAVGWPIWRSVTGQPINPFKRSPDFTGDLTVYPSKNRGISNKKRRNWRRPNS